MARLVARVGHILTAFSALSLAGPASAADPWPPRQVCAPGEDPSVCIVKVQRQDALDSAALGWGQVEKLDRWIAGYVAGVAAQRRAADAEARLRAEYWHLYVAGSRPWWKLSLRKRGSR